MQKKMTQSFILILGLMLLGMKPSQAVNALTVIPEIKHDLLPALVANSTLSNISHNKKYQSFISPMKKITDVPVNIFTGMGVGLGDYQVKALLPDVYGAVGMKQYVQTVNYDIAVFDKKTGELFKGFPQSNHVMWKGFGGQCEKEIGKYQLVKYDQLANRWILTHTTSSSLCVAVSVGEDATGAYNRYAFNLNAWAVNARLGLWPTAYFMSFDLRDKTFYTDSLACALDRTNMLAGKAASAQCQVVPRHFYTITHVTPADLEGKILPGWENIPHLFVGVNQEWFRDTLSYFIFNVDFISPNNSYLTNPVTFQTTNHSFPTILRQENFLSMNVDNNGIHLSPHLAYRVIKDDYYGFIYGSLWGCKTANLSNYAINQYWFQATMFDGIFHTGQAGTLSDLYSDHYTGSIASDKVNNIAIANNVSSFRQYISIELNYRNPSDLPNTFNHRQLILGGQGSQFPFNYLNNWGDYSSLTIDPEDDCTFWYTNTILHADGNKNWSTAIINFKFPNCV